MIAVAWLVARRSWRRDLWSLLLVALLAGGSLGVAVALVDGADRTRTAYDRFSAEARDMDTFVPIGDVDDATIERLRSLPGVRSSMVASIGGIFAVFDDPNLYVPMLIDREGAYGHDLQVGRVLRGRRADPDAPLEITLDEPLAQLTGLDAGDTLHIESLTPAQMEKERAGTRHGPARGPALDLQIVGVVRQPGGLNTSQPIASFIATTPAFGQKYGDRIGEWGRALTFDLGSPSDSGARAFIPALHEVPGFETVQLTSLASGAPIQPTLDFTATAMLVLTAAVALAGVGAAALVLVRVVAGQVADDAVLTALGAVRRDRRGVRLLRAVPAIVGSALFVVVASAAASAFLPFGLARRAEPDPGVRVDSLLVAAGVVVATAVIASIVAVSGRRLARDDVARPSERAGLVARLRRLPLAVPALVGVGLAFDRRRGVARLPTRTAVLGVLLGISSLLAAGIVAASVDHLLATPEAQGLTWDLKVLDDRASGELVDSPAVAAVADVRIATVEIAGVPLEVQGIDVRKGEAPLQLLDGRAPTGPREIVLGTRTMRSLGVGIGDTVPVGGGDAAEPFTVVGRAAFAGLSDLPLSGDSAAVRGDELFRLVEGRGDEGFVNTVIDLAPGEDVSSIAALLPPQEQVEGELAYSLAADEPVPIDVERLHEVENLPWALTIFLGLVALVAVGHASLSLVRRRRHDLAILRSLGLARGAVARSVVIQAVLVVSTGLAVGVPVGLALGQIVWRTLADSIGVAAEVEVPWLVVVAVPLCTVAVVAVLALVPARAAARIRPARVLRTE